MSLRSIHLNLRRTPATPDPRDAMDDSQQRGPHLFLSQAAHATLWICDACSLRSWEDT
jgi:hypothetical protein